MRRHPARGAFTLLEVMLAMGIGMVLLAALYTAMNVQLRHAKAARDVVEQGSLVRSIMARVGSDIRSNLGPNGVNVPSDGSGSGTPGTPAAGTTPSGGSSTTTPSSQAASVPGGSGTAGGGSAGAMAPGGVTASQVTFNLGVQGDATHLNLYVSRVPREAIQAQQAGAVDPINPLGVSDLRRITYWLVDGAGLARQEVLQVTSDDAMNAVPPNLPDEASYVIAEEVKGLEFSYFDGTAWQDTWDGTAVGADGQTPVGPPMAIAVVLAIAQPNTGAVKTYRQVVFIPTANGLGQPQQ